MIQLLLNKTTTHFQLLPTVLITHSWGAAFTVTKSSYNTIAEDEALSNIYIYVFDTFEDERLCTYFPGPAIPGQPLELTCSSPLNGIYVKIQQRKDPILEPIVLSMCEIEVYVLQYNGKLHYVFLC